MPSVLVVAALVSQSEFTRARQCSSCGTSDDGSFLSIHICPKCRLPHEVRSDENYFSVLGAPLKFCQDLPTLQKKFYEVSRALHPDRFTTASDEAKKNSLSRMSLLNDAFKTLRTQGLLRDYVLTLFGLKSPEQKKGQIPLELAESWFELQDAISEEPADAADQIQSFRDAVMDFEAQVEAGIRGLEAELDGLIPGSAEYLSLLQKLALALNEMSYVKSLLRDVERITGRK